MFLTIPSYAIRPTVENSRLLFGLIGLIVVNKH